MPGPADYTVGWICAIEAEYLAAQLCLDEEHPVLPRRPSSNDSNSYTLGQIAGHNVVVACLPDGSYGTSSASTVAINMLRSFPNVRVGLMVGIGGGVPRPHCDIRLGDIVVSSPGDGKGGVIQYDYGKAIQREPFQETAFLNQPPTSLRTAVMNLKVALRRKPGSLEEAIDNIIENEEDLREDLGRPSTNKDRLYRSDYVHQNGGKSCTETCGDDPSHFIQRAQRTKRPKSPMIHYGLIASGNQLMKDALRRDELAAKHKILCFEMEAAGLMNDFPCLVIRGICDYSDTHKNDEWQGYASLAAAAYARELLKQIPPDDILAEKQIADIVDVIKTVQRNIHSLVQSQLVEERRLILDWLSPADFAMQHSDVIERRQPGTGQWFLQSNEFNLWLMSPGRTLYCPGIPGAGKTVMTAVVVDCLWSKFVDDQRTGIAHIYCSFQRQAEQTPRELLAGLLKQLMGQRASSARRLEEFYHEFRKTGLRPSSEDIQRTLQSVAATYSKVFIVIDALDECQTADDNLSTILSVITRLRSNVPLNIFATSRPSGILSAYFSKGIVRTISATDADILKYVDARLAQRHYDILDEHWEAILRQNVLRASDGMFLLAQLHMDALLSQLSKGDLKQCVQSLGRGSAGLDMTYKQAMHRIEDQGSPRELLAKQILSWIVHSRRQLSTLELQHALTIHEGSTAMDTEFLPAAEAMLSVCAGLVMIDRASDTVRLIHYTAHEFFERTWKTWFPDAELHVAKQCLTYLSLDAFGCGACATDEAFEERLQSNPLYEYAAQHWGHHAREIPDFCYKDADFLRSNKKLESLSQALMVVGSKGTGGYSQLFPRKMTALHFVAYFGIENTARLLIDENGWDKKDSHGRTPMSYASENGRGKIVGMLLDMASVTVNTMDQYGRTPLLYAVRNRHGAVVKRLLESGEADVNAEDKQGHTPWSLAVSHVVSDGCSVIIKLLVSTGNVDVNVKMYGESGESLILWAINCGDEALAELLLRTGQVDVGVRSLAATRGTPLIQAAMKGYEVVVQLLLGTAKANVEAREVVYGQTALSLAADEGHTGVVRALINEGRADVNTRDRSDDTPLLLALRNGNIDAAKLLMETGAVDTGARDLWGNSALDLAMGSRRRIVEGYRKGDLEMLDGLIQTLILRGFDSSISTHGAARVIQVGPRGTGRGPGRT